MYHCKWFIEVCGQQKLDPVIGYDEDQFLFEIFGDKCPFSADRESTLLYSYKRLQ